MYLFLALYIFEFLKFLIFFEKTYLNRSLCVCMVTGTDSEEFVLLSQVRMGHKREFSFAMKA